MNNVSNSNPLINELTWKEQEGAKYADPSENQKLEQQDFFKLLTEQLNMQDPTKPVDNDQMIAQMTSFTMAEGITGLQEQFTKFTDNMSSNQALQASTLVGRQVLVPTNSASIDGGGKASGVIAAPQTAQNVKIRIKDENDSVVRTIDVGDLAAGTKDFEWDGLDESGNSVPAGKYTFTANGQLGNSAEDLPLQMHATVQSVSTGGDRGIVLNLKGLGGINFKDVTEIG
ncbi:flagellar basal-body rod modification protein FlgD [Idiomarina fontislapidosi]|uniref:Basal-body rod modification protein FlgD n=1 Tax=Idiomarina fontislapidosi TaxID=263723 RepID=A0A432XYG2_9GAMM|nr:flagellar hook assembly protein FlgD [Idiomarina fontislapidosi]PYE32777.1 flagellar basal-body rod modification protein FlgD [Idiomarina fontislapidosi]RUO53782.1 flagellar hook assembly protein FlgD [Idiomarina fontislapidosi]